MILLTVISVSTWPSDLCLLQVDILYAGDSKACILQVCSSSGLLNVSIGKLKKFLSLLDLLLANLPPDPRFSVCFITCILKSWSCICCMLSLYFLYRTISTILYITLYWVSLCLGILHCLLFALSSFRLSFLESTLHVAARIIFLKSFKNLLLPNYKPEERNCVIALCTLCYAK